MRRLTFNGYLRSYVPYLAGEDTQSLERLWSTARAEPRLVEPLLLWAVKSDRAQRLESLLTDNKRLREELALLETLERVGSLDTALAKEDSRLRPEYAKVWRSYQSRAKAPERDAELKLEARRRALELEKTKHVTRYRMAKDLGLNPGNLHAFLAQGNTGKVALSRARQLVEYLEAA